MTEQRLLQSRRVPPLYLHYIILIFHTDTTHGLFYYGFDNRISHLLSEFSN